MDTLRKSTRAIILAVCLVLIVSVGLTLAYFTAQDVVRNTFAMKCLNISLDEVWNPQDGRGVRPGTIVVKKPVITATEGDCYMRVVVKISEVNTGAPGSAAVPITDPARLAKIRGTLFYDAHNAIALSGSYTAAQLAALPGVTPFYNTGAFSPSGAASIPLGTSVVEYNGVFAHGTSAELLSKVVIPLDYTEADMALMGDYLVSLQGQAVQNEVFASQHDAFAALDAIMPISE
ncbi:MAG: SipW-dependent-type signal peptide-containing protein [Raoultibacter sp.]